MYLVRTIPAKSRTTTRMETNQEFQITTCHCIQRCLQDKLTSKLGHSNFLLIQVYKFLSIAQILTGDKATFNNVKSFLSEDSVNHYSQTQPFQAYNREDVTEALETSFPSVNFTKIFKFTPLTKPVWSYYDRVIVMLDMAFVAFIARLS